MALIHPDPARMVELRDEHGLIGARRIALREILVKRCQDLARREGDSDVADILETIVSLLTF
jgi:hypothetical protein